MKNIILVILGVSIIACSKTAIKTTSIIIPIQQDVNLLGSWSLDSSGYVGYKPSATSSDHDTVKISKASFQDWMLSGEADSWQTINDSILLSQLNGVRDNHYQYIITGKILVLCLKGSGTSPNIKYWLSKK